MADFTNVLLWAVVGRVRAIPADGSKSRARAWDHRNVVITAKDYQAAHEVAIDALLKNWSSQPHEAEVFAVRPAVVGDLQSFKYESDPAYRVLVTEVADAL